MARSPKPIRKQMLQYLVIAAYFLFWSYKIEIRHGSKIGSLCVLSVSVLLIPLGLAAEIYKSQLLNWILSPFNRYPKLSFALVAVSVLYLVWHHFAEARKPGYEYNFVQRLCDFMEGRDPHGARDHAWISKALELFHSVFERAGVAHASLYTLRDGSLTINSRHVYPEEESPAFFVPLAIGEGVAGRVFSDLKIRYVPRLFFPFSRKHKWLPTFSFPHAVKLSFRKVEAGGLGRLELGDEGLDTAIFKAPGDEAFPFRSFLSVPLKSAQEGRCLGVLNFDFDRVDPLDKMDVAMVAVFGLLLAGEIERTGAEARE